mmetsp:Transcript_22333/g.48869  ORF Transcript_22333/g.48869 Transcript_22333/m.48869 type:complete len:222 (-) Transcript_22333:79-744(-)
MLPQGGRQPGLCEGGTAGNVGRAKFGLDTSGIASKRLDASSGWQGAAGAADDTSCSRRVVHGLLHEGLASKGVCTEAGEGQEEEAAAAEGAAAAAAAVAEEAAAEVLVAAREVAAAGPRNMDKGATGGRLASSEPAIEATLLLDLGCTCGDCGWLPSRLSSPLASGALAARANAGTGASTVALLLLANLSGDSVVLPPRAEFGTMGDRSGGGPITRGNMCW